MSETILEILISPNLYNAGIVICMVCIIFSSILSAIENHRKKDKKSQKNHHKNIPELVSWADSLVILDLTIFIVFMNLLFFFFKTGYLRLRDSNIGVVFTLIVGTSMLLVFLESYRNPLEKTKESETILFSNFVFATLFGNQQFVTSIIDFLNLSNEIYITITLILVVGLHYAFFLFCVVYSISILVRKMVLMTNLKLRNIVGKVLNFFHQKKIIKMLTHPLIRWYDSRCNPTKPKLLLFSMLYLLEVFIGLLKFVVTWALAYIWIVIIGIILTLRNLFSFFLKPLIDNDIKDLQHKILIFSSVLALLILYIQIANINILTSIQNSVFELIVAIVIIPYLLSIMIELNKKETNKSSTIKNVPNNLEDPNTN